MNRSNKHYWLTEADFEAIPADEISSEKLVEKPLVSVLMVAWNHAEFIGEAIESVVTQKSEYQIELIIGEDNSSDDTLSVCHSLQEKYPDIIRIVTSDENLGMHHNFARIWHRAKGELIAFCDGDDYWVDSLKLQKQIDWFKANPNGSLVGAITDKLFRDGEGEWAINGRSAPLEIKKTYSFESLLQNYSFHFSSVMVRKSSVHFPRWLWDVYCVDRPLYLFAAENGSVGLLPEVTSCYRQHEGGNWSPRSQLSKGEASTELFHLLSRHLGGKYAKTCRETLAGILWSYLQESFELGDRSAARRLYWQSLREDWWGRLRNMPKNVVVLFVWIHFPGFYRK